MTKQFTPASFMTAASQRALIRTITFGELSNPRWTIVEIITGLRHPGGNLAWIARLSDLMNYNGPAIHPPPARGPSAIIVRSAQSRE